MSDINLYIEGKKVWSSVIEELQRTAGGWRRCSLGLFILLLVALVGIAYIGSLSKVKPVLVVLDENYLPVGFYSGSGNISVRDPNVTKALLAKVITDWRVVSLDGEYQRKRFNDLAAFMSKDGGGFQKVVGYLNDPETNPFKRAGSGETVLVKINSILKVTESTWQVNWTEDSFFKGREVPVKKEFQANITFQFLEDIPSDVLLLNPVGLLIVDLNWVEVSK